MNFLFYDADDTPHRISSKSFSLENGESGTGKCSKGIFDHKYCEFLFEYYITDEDDNKEKKSCYAPGSGLVYLTFELECDITYNFTHKCDYNRI
eukprot:Pgem_evm1s20261